MISVSDGDWRLLIGASAGGAGRLFDRSRDPGEQVDVSKQQPEALAHMKQLAKAYLEKPSAPWGPAPEVGIGAEELQQLRALGYSVE
jgi:hypothetical protein